MQDVNGKVAFITGGASGIGLALARACGEAGMRVMLADIDIEAAKKAAGELRTQGVEAGAVYCDVSNEPSLRDAADSCIETFGKVHLLANNAGVLCKGGAGEMNLDRWRWAVDVNVMGVVQGVEIFLPLLREHGEWAHILNTASVGGHAGFGGMLAYCTTKHAVVGFSDSLYHQLAPENIGVSVLCPGFVSTRIAETERYSSAAETFDEGLHEAVAAGMSPDVVAGFALEQLRKGALYIFTHPGTQDEVEERFGQVTLAFAETRSSELISSDPDAGRVADRDTTEKLQR